MLRAIFTAMVMFVVLIVLIDTKPQGAAAAGRDLFIGYTVIQTLMAVLLAPLLVSQGISEERDDKTLELLTMTHLSATQIVWGKIVSRLLVLTTVVIGATPVLALISTFGGVGLWEVVNATVGTVTTIAVLGGLGAVVGLITRGSGAASVVVLSWCLLAWVMVPMAFVAATGEQAPMLAWLSPPLATTSSGPMGLLSVLAAVPLIWLIARWAGPLFQMTTGAHDPSLSRRRMPGYERLEALRRRSGWLGLVVLATAPLAIAPTVPRVRGLIPYYVPRLPLDLGLWLWTCLLTLAATSLLLLLLLAALDLFERWSMFKATMRATGGGPWFSNGVPAIARRWVWPNPVAWRELMTGAYGPSGVLARWGVVAWFIGMSFVVMTVGAREAPPLFALSGTATTMVFTVTLATATMGTERAAGTLPLLLSTTIRSHQVVLGKLFSVAIYTIPYGLLGWAFVVVSGWWRMDVRDEPFCPGPGMLVGGSFAQIATTFAWLVAAWACLALASMLVATVVRPARLAWGLNAAGAVLAIFTPIAIHDVMPWRYRDAFYTLVFPVNSPSWGTVHCGISPWAFASVAVYGSVALALLVAISLTLRRSTLRGG